MYLDSCARFVEGHLAVEYDLFEGLGRLACDKGPRLPYLGFKYINRCLVSCCSACTDTGVTVV